MWEEDYIKIKEYRKKHPAPVDKFGVHILPEKDLNSNTFRYQTLISVLLSSRTKDAKTAASMKNLQKHGLNIKNILKTSENKIKDLIKDVGFAKTKAKYIKNITFELHSNFNDDIPDNIEELLKLKGIGPKIGTLTMLIAWGKVTGISVDSHIHRIANVLKWVKTKSPNETAKELEKLIPKRYWKEINQILVGFGQLNNTAKKITRLFKK